MAAFVADVDKTALLTARSVMRAPDPASDPTSDPGAALGYEVSPDTPLPEVVRLASRGAAALPVVSEGRLVGIITAQSVLAALAERSPAPERRA